MRFIKKLEILNIVILREGTLFPDEVLRYEPFIIRESLNNAIAHQDFTKGARINVVELKTIIWCFLIMAHSCLNLLKK